MYFPSHLGILDGTGFDLSTFSAIRSCTLRFATHGMCVRQNIDLAWIPRVLSQLATHELRKLSISLAVYNVEDLRGLNSECAAPELTAAYFDDMTVLDWESLEQILVNDHLAGLDKVTLEGRGRSDNLEEHIKRVCPQLYCRGMLSLLAVSSQTPNWVL